MFSISPSSHGPTNPERSAHICGSQKTAGAGPAQSRAGVGFLFSHSPGRRTAAGRSPNLLGLAADRDDSAGHRAVQRSASRLFPPQPSPAGGGWVPREGAWRGRRVSCFLPPEAVYVWNADWDETVWNVCPGPALLGGRAPAVSSLQVPQLATEQGEWPSLLYRRGDSLSAGTHFQPRTVIQQHRNAGAPGKQHPAHGPPRLRLASTALGTLTQQMPRSVPDRWPAPVGTPSTLRWDTVPSAGGQSEAVSRGACLL